MAPGTASRAMKTTTTTDDDPELSTSAPMRRSSRVTRKVQPGIQEKIKPFLASAASNLESVSKFSSVSPIATLKSRKRKLADLDPTNETSSASSIVPKKEREPEPVENSKKRLSPLAKAKKQVVDRDEDDAVEKPKKRVASIGKTKKPAVVDDDDDAADIPKKRIASLGNTKKQAVLDDDGDAAKSSKKTKKDDEEEKRLRMFRKAPPGTFLEKLNRARTQRMIVIGRKRTDTAAFPSEEIDIVGSTGNIYKVTISQTCSCTCPDSKKGNECKHKVYALHTVLRAPEKLQYQLALLSSELREIFANAPAIPTNASGSSNTDGTRKPVDGECPICYMDFDEKNNELVWCKAACGNNMHKFCFNQWAASQRRQTVKCVYCRAPWQAEPADLKSLTQDGYVNLEGFVNVGHQFGMSEVRDTSSYHQPWVRRNMNYY